MTCGGERASVLSRTAHQRPGIGVSSAFGTFGELLQGTTGDGVEFLVTLPIACWATATFIAEPYVPGIDVRPAHKLKAVRLARSLLSAIGQSGGGRILLDSMIPEGKGLASSSADLVATARAITNAFGIEVSPATIEAFLRPIEPTDGVMYDAVTVFNHRRVALRAVAGSLPPLTVVSLDEGGTVDTVAFNRRPKPFTRDDKREYGQLLAALTRAVRAGDVRTVGRIATRSAELNQRLHRKTTFADLRKIGSELDALGIVVAHSGTVLGILLADDDPSYALKRAEALHACTALAGNATVYHTLCFK